MHRTYKTLRGLKAALAHFDKRGLLNSWYYDETTHLFVVNISEPR